MIALIEDNRAAIAAVCREHGVRRLSVFGSAATGAFDPATSDLDVLIDFADYGPGVGKRFMRVVASLEDALGQTLDVTTMPIKDDTFRHEVERTEVVLYESDRRETAA